MSSHNRFIIYPIDICKERRQRIAQRVQIFLRCRDHVSRINLGGLPQYSIINSRLSIPVRHNKPLSNRRFQADANRLRHLIRVDEDDANQGHSGHGICLEGDALNNSTDGRLAL